ncbi:MAG: hypothetical protein Q7R41_00740, partial [Phycisphaerales bacterium]|nr:hypothetical protein [Phycisphaerales bacterium]
MNLIDIELAQPLDEDQKTTVHITYDGRLGGYAELGMKYIQDRIDRQFTILREDSDAYPQVRPDSWADRKGLVSSTSFTYAINVTVPKGLVV